jgi:hypothetical protein
MPVIGSKKTFKEELSDIGKIPGVLDTQRVDDSSDGYPEEIGQYEPWIFESRDRTDPSYDNDGAPEPNSFPIGSHRAMPIQGTIIEDILTGNIESLDGLMEDLQGRGFDPTGYGADVIARRIAVFGSGAFASYLPWHIYAYSKRTPWGIYLFAEPLLVWGHLLTQTAQACGFTLTYLQGLSLAVQVAFRHELFHYHVERFGIRSEVLGRQPIYLPYRNNVFLTRRNTPDWLEEALAQAVVLKSKLVSKRVFGLPKSKWKPVLDVEFAKFGAGYSDHACTHVGGVEKAHALLAAQIQSATIVPPFTVTKQFTPKSEYSTSYKKVPGYIMSQPSLLSQFQLAGPNERQWRRFSNAQGISPEAPTGAGDHAEVRYGKQKIHINYDRNGEMDRASLKAAKEMVGFKGSLRAFIQSVRHS